MKKLIALLLTIVMLMSQLTACVDLTNNDNQNKPASQSAEETQQSSTKNTALEKVRNNGKLVVATSPDYPPLESLENGQIVGIEVDIMQKVCEKLGVNLEFVQDDFDAVLKNVQDGKCDCAASGIIVTEDRKQNMLFSDPFYELSTVIVVKEGSAIRSKADLAGKVVSVQSGTTAEFDCQMEGITTQSFNANADAKAALTTGKVDAWVLDHWIAIQMIQENDGLQILQEKMTEECYALAFPLGSEPLVTEINGILKTMIEDGTMEAIFTQYGEPYFKPQ